MSCDYTLYNEDRLVVISFQLQVDIDRVYGAISALAVLFANGDLPDRHGVMIVFDKVVDLMDTEVWHAVFCIRYLQSHFQGPLALVCAEAGKVVPVTIIALSTNSPTRPVEYFQDETSARPWIQMHLFPLQ